VHFSDTDAVIYMGTTAADADTIEQELQSGKICVFFNTLHTFFVPHFTLVKDALIEIGCVVTSLVGWLVVTVRSHRRRFVPDFKIEKFAAKSPQNPSSS